MNVWVKWTGAGLFALALGVGGVALAKPPFFGGPAIRQFERIATFYVCENTVCDRDVIEETSAEIVVASEDGRTLAYSDSPAGLVGLVDISDPAHPAPLGTLALGGEPTSVAISGDWLLVALNTSVDFVSPSGVLVVYSLSACIADPGCAPVVELDLAGQPDSIAVGSNRRWGAIAIENERDEDIEVDGVEGGLPQLPAGSLQVLSMAGPPAGWSLSTVDLTGLAGYAPEDPEVEYVSIGKANLAAVTLQENNHVAIVHLPTASVIADFPAGSVDLDGVDAVEDDVIDPSDALVGLAREPDAIAWLDFGLLATANEGDLFGGSRGFTVFTPFGHPLFDSGVEVEYLAMATGHYPEGRSENKGTEPEGVAYGRYQRDRYLFVGSERGNFVAVYDARLPWRPRFVQLLPTGIGPEGLLPLPKRNLFVVAAETDDEDPRSQISIFQLQRGRASYPTILSEPHPSGPLAGQAPIGWVALSALAADRDDADRLYTAHDSFLAQSRLYTVDVSQTPARIDGEIVLMKGGGTVDYDVEGLVQRADGSFWVVSEGSEDFGDADLLPNLLVRVGADGTVAEEVELPAAVAMQQKNNGFEGVAVTGSGASEQVYVAFQREWADDPAGLVRIGRYTPSTDEWRFFHYPLDPNTSPEASWVGLSEIVAIDDDTLLVLERDNAGGPTAAVKRLYSVSIAGVTPAEQGDTFPELDKVGVRDLVPDLAAPQGWLQEKVEGVAIAIDGQVYVVTDNDGVDGNTGETQLLRLGDLGL